MPTTRFIIYICVFLKNNNAFICAFLLTGDAVADARAGSLRTGEVVVLQSQTGQLQVIMPGVFAKVDLRGVCFFSSFFIFSRRFIGYLNTCIEY